MRAAAAPWRPWVVTLLAALGLNTLLSMNNVWPTPWIVPDHRLAPEFVGLWLLLLVIVAWSGRPGARTLDLLAAVFLVLVLGRYLDVTVPALFGRPVNLYWDTLQLPRFIDVASQAYSGWVLAAVPGVALLALYGLFRLVRAAIARLATHAAPWALGSGAGRFLSLVAALLVIANTAGVQATWPFVSRPVSPTYARQAGLLAAAFLPGAADRVLAASPAFDRGLDGLNGASVRIVFLESYGAVVYDDPQIAAWISGGHAGFQRRVRDTGRAVVSAVFRSPTFGGASDLAHLSLLSGLDLSDPLHHDLLLTTQRKTLLDQFEAHGYDTIGLYPALSWEWPERSFYGYGEFIDGPALAYRGPKFGLWWIPDQYALAHFESTRAQRAPGRPHLLFFATITSHIPFRPVPPVQDDWARLLTDDPFDAAEVERSLADEIDWADLREPYARTIDYAFRWLGSYLEQPWMGDDLLILIGDHQPVASISGPGASWDVPVHVISRDHALIERFRRAGFSDGLRPARRSLGRFDELTRLLQDVFDGGADGRQHPLKPAG